MKEEQEKDQISEVGNLERMKDGTNKIRDMFKKAQLVLRQS